MNGDLDELLQLLRAGASGSSSVSSSVSIVEKPAGMRDTRMEQADEDYVNTDASDTVLADFIGQARTKIQRCKKEVLRLKHSVGESNQELKTEFLWVQQQLVQEKQKNKQLVRDLNKAREEVLLEKTSHEADRKDEFAFKMPSREDDSRLEKKLRELQHKHIALTHEHEKAALALLLERSERASQAEKRIALERIQTEAEDKLAGLIGEPVEGARLDLERVVPKVKNYCETMAYAHEETKSDYDNQLHIMHMEKEAAEQQVRPATSSAGSQTELVNNEVPSFMSKLTKALASKKKKKFGFADPGPDAKQIEEEKPYPLQRAREVVYAFYREKIVLGIKMSQYENKNLDEVVFGHYLRQHGLPSAAKLHANKFLENLMVHHDDAGGVPCLLFCTSRLHCTISMHSV
jgi:hypothetical protein